MAGLGFKDFAVGEVLTSADVDGYLMQQSVMRFADAGARGSALGTAVGTGVALAEGMVAYLDDANVIEVFDGSAWRGVGGFDSVTTITATDASWTVPTLADPVVRVTVVGGGGGGGGSGSGGGTGGAGSSSVFGVGEAFETTAGGGAGGYPANNLGGSSLNGSAGYSHAAGNGGQGGYTPGSNPLTAQNGLSGQVVVAYIDLTGVTTTSVTIGAGGAGDAAAGNGGNGGAGRVIFEYRAG